ncbi:MAG TPA: glycosyltransferase family 87 protein [Terriglobales bacterium]|nr:glycosyltransferase family 87 protein [Terriglobales bacterium]
MNQVRLHRFVVIYAAALILLHGIILWNARHLIRKGYPDFTIFYSAARLVREGFGHSLYDLQVQYRVQREFASGVSIRQGALPYNHPPFETILFMPLSSLPYLGAYLVWDTLNLVLLAGVLWCVQSGLEKKWPGLWWGLFLCLAFFPVCVALLQGQDIILFVLWFAAAYVSLKRGNDLAAGCWLGLGLFRFQLVLPFVAMLGLRKRWRALAGFFAMAGVLGLVSVAIVGWHGLWDYPHYVWFVEGTMAHEAISDMPNLRGFLAALLTGRIPTLVLDGITVVLSLGLVIFGASHYKPGLKGERFDLAFSLCVVIVVLVSYHSFAYDLCLLLLPVALVTNYVRSRGTIDLPRQILLIGPIFVLFLGPLHMVLLIHYGQLNVLAILLVLWAWAIGRELALSSLDEEALLPSSP